MTKLLETPAMQFELPDGLDYIFDNTPLSSEDLQCITEMIQKLKLEDSIILPADEDLYVGNTPESESDKRRIAEYVKKSKAKVKRSERYLAQKLT